MNPEKSLTVEVRNLTQPEAERTTFDLIVGFDAQFDLEQQLWERGWRIYGGSSQARAIRPSPGRSRDPCFNRLHDTDIDSSLPQM